jgi:heat shock protein HtpX
VSKGRNIGLHAGLAESRRKSAFLLAGFFCLVLLVVGAFSQVVGGGLVGFVIALVVTAAMSFFAWHNSDRVALSMSHAVVADEKQYARFHNLVEGLCVAGGIPKPRLYVVQDNSPNAFATGRDPQHAAIAVTTGLLEKMNRLELEGVLAHELAHIKNNDILVATVAVTLVGALALLSDWGLRFLWWGGPRHRNDQNSNDNNALAPVMMILGFALLIVTPLIGRLMQMAVSRQRETLADVTAVSLTRYPPGLISALTKLRDDTTIVHSASKATAHLWIESPLTDEPGQVVNPKEERTAKFNRMFMTHPPIDERIAALREL